MVTLPTDSKNIDRLSRYRTFRRGMDTGDLIEFRSNSVIGCGIRWKTGNRVNHTAPVIRLKRYAEERVFLLEALEHGIVINLLSRRLENFDGYAEWLGVKQQYIHFRRDIGRAMLSYVGVPYDYGSIIRQLFARVSADAEKLFCSEFAAIALKDAGLPVSLDPVPYPGDMVALGIHRSPLRIL